MQVAKRRGMARARVAVARKLACVLPKAMLVVERAKDVSHPDS
jgi:hypothetical protein